MSEEKVKRPYELINEPPRGELANTSTRWAVRTYAKIDPTKFMDSNAKWDGILSSNRMVEYGPMMNRIVSHPLSRYIRYKHLFQVTYEAEMRESDKTKVEGDYRQRVHQARKTAFHRMLDFLNYLGG